jgi:hypothetical protein
MGVPAVNIGSRQINRQRGKNVIDVPHKASEIQRGIEERVSKFGLLAEDHVYGNGTAGIRIADQCAETLLTHYKTITY